MVDPCKLGKEIKINKYVNFIFVCVKMEVDSILSHIYKISKQGVKCSLSQTSGDEKKL